MIISDFIKAVLLGLVEGLTEFLPVSSTGHLILVGDALQFTGDKAKAFEVFIQLGAILSVVVLYSDRFVSLLRGAFPIGQWFKLSTYRTAGGGLDGAPGILNVAVTSLPAIIAGLIFRHKIESLFEPRYVAMALVIGGIVFLIVEKVRPEPRITELKDISLRKGFFIGCWQALALWPGVSRSGATLVGALLLGVERRTAADFSFIIAVPLVTAAALVNFIKVAGSLSSSDFGIFAVGFVVSFFAGIASIRILLGVLKRYSLRPFGYYRIILGSLVLASILF